MCGSGRRRGRGSVALLIALAGCNNADSDQRAPPATDGIVTLDGPGTEGPNDDGDDEGEKLDVEQGTGGESAEGGDCMGDGMNSDDVEFSLIWIANSPEGTVSKIDTTTGMELARYYTGPGMGTDDPSRTSVNLLGDVAVANRGGSLTKIAAQEEQCVDANGNGMIDTSTGSTDILPWGSDECVLWFVDLPDPPPGNQQGPRPTAWDAGTMTGNCVNNDARVWNGWWVEAEGTAYFKRFDGLTGNILDEVTVPGYAPGQDWGYGPYGGAVDADGNFFVSGLLGPLLRIDAETLEVDIWPMPAGSGPYGIAVDANGHVWTAGLENGELTHFDPTTETFDVYPTPNGVLRGLMIDRNGQLWAAGNDPCGLVQFDVESRTIVNGAVPLPGCITPVGVSIDVDGYVWAPDQGANLAFKVDPVTYTSTTTTGLVQPYTYSDMTGAGLGLVVNPPVG